MTWAGTAGVDSIQLGRCVDGKVTDKEVAQNIAEGHALGLNATPTLFINGRKFEGAMEWPIMQQLVQLEIDHQAEDNARRTKCEETCVVTIPKDRRQSNSTRAPTCYLQRCRIRQRSGRKRLPQLVRTRTWRT